MFSGNRLSVVDLILIFYLYNVLPQTYRIGCSTGPVREGLHQLMQIPGFTDYDLDQIHYTKDNVPYKEDFTLENEIGNCTNQLQSNQLSHSHKGIVKFFDDSLQTPFTDSERADIAMVKEWVKKHMVKGNLILNLLRYILFKLT